MLFRSGDHTAGYLRKFWARSWVQVLLSVCQSIRQSVIFLTYMRCPRLCSHGGWLLLKCSAHGIGFNGAETNCGIAGILGILLINSWDTEIYFLATTIIWEMKRRQGVKTLIQNPFPFPLNSPTRRVKLASLFFPSCQSPFPVRHLLCRLRYTEGQQILKL